MRDQRIDKMVFVSVSVSWYKCLYDFKNLFVSIFIKRFECYTFYESSYITLGRSYIFFSWMNLRATFLFSELSNLLLKSSSDFLIFNVLCSYFGLQWCEICLTLLVCLIGWYFMYYVKSWKSKFRYKCRRRCLVFFLK